MSQISTIIVTDKTGAQDLSNTPVHNLKDVKTYPNYHLWRKDLHNYDFDRLQTYANTPIKIGDLINTREGKSYEVIGYPFEEKGEQIQLKTYVNKQGKKEVGVGGVLVDLIGSVANIDKYTRFYKLIVKEVI